MRPPRIAILALFLTATLFLFCRFIFSSAVPSVSSAYPTTATTSTTKPKTKPDRSVWGLVYYNTPFSLFPPNAAISLTDDNSTSFAARPAAFGPKLVTKGLSGQLWVGSGFAEDSLDGNGELGCSDLPGWDSGNGRTNLKNALKAAAPRVALPKEDDAAHPKRDDELLDRDNRNLVAGSRLRLRAANDGTDNHLLQGTDHVLARHDASGSASHADIQSIQEAAEIQGKVVLLMRGGCGFLEKVMWAQRRGAIAVIVGDNQKGGPLIQMFAHGDDVENVTIPSVFTARTTAHLLSSLTQPGSFVEDSLDDGGNPVLKVQQGSRVNKNKKSEAGTAVSPKTTVTSAKEKRTNNKDKAPNSASSGLLSSLFSLGGSSPAPEDKSRPPSSGRLDWVLVEDFDDEKDKIIRDSMEKKVAKKTKDSKSTVDDFVIGVQDWRDPDLRDSKSTKDMSQQPKSAFKEGFKSSGKGFSDANGPKGGSITPGSGEYNPGKFAVKDTSDALSRPPSTKSVPRSGKGFLAKLFGKDEGSQDDAEVLKGADAFSVEAPPLPEVPDSDTHEGLWVTITPTSSASPFFDTLLVLVISPLVTLTVVYALLILRARIRRRRWRAPKSVVERLPVRTYHTVAASPNLSPRLPSPNSSSPTTPLLQQSVSRPRPRSRTTTGIPEDENLLSPSSALATPRTASRNRHREHEKGSGGFSAEWKKYMGRQVECVVCLEEYIDGVSRVMSLPCGHEFHVECITPWLTTRRRTCPICKGDVVRSLKRGGSSSPRYEPYHDDSDDDDEADAEGSGSRSAERDLDLEQGLLSPDPGPSRGWARHERWMSLFSAGYNGRGQSPAESPSQSRSRSPEDRNR